MNRAERRRQQRLAVKNLNAGQALDIQQALDLATQHRDQGELSLAAGIYQQILKTDPDQPVALHLLGLVAHQTGRNDVAVNLITKALAVKPDFALAHNNLGLIMLASNQVAEALECFNRAVNLEPTNGMFWFSYSSLLNTSSFGSWDEGVGQDLLLILDQPTVIPKRIVASIASALHHHPIFMQVKALADSGSLEGKINEVTAWLSDIPLLLKILKLSTINDIGFERLLTRLRHEILLAVASGETITGGLPFQAALALHCFNNEYVFNETPEEKDEIEALRQKMANTLENDGEIVPVWIAVLGSYCELLDFSFAQRLLEHEWPEDIQAVVTRQVKEPLEERVLKPQIPTLTPIQNKVSQAVRDQYEDNPYPRWIRSTTYDKPRMVGEIFRNLKLPLDWDSFQAPEKPEILIAGCGTGQQSLLSASRYAHATLLAVDLSLSSLAYALRKTRELGISNIEYVQGDILELENLNRTFDIIECRGVLHHLEDPLAGWRVLVELLRPGGMMKIGLYSGIARQGHVEAWRLIKDRGYSTSLEDIRRFRQDVLAMPPDSESGMVRNQKSVDFFSTSDCRDLYFHVQEHHFSLPQIETTLQDLGLTFLGFELSDARIATKFCLENPKPEALSSLALWHRFEQENPSTFSALYEFWAQKSQPRIKQGNPIKSQH